MSNHRNTAQIVHRAIHIGAEGRNAVRRVQGHRRHQIRPTRKLRGNLVHGQQTIGQTRSTTRHGYRRCGTLSAWTCEASGPLGRVNRRAPLSLASLSRASPRLWPFLCPVRSMPVSLQSTRPGRLSDFQPGIDARLVTHVEIKITAGPCRAEAKINFLHLDSGHRRRDIPPARKDCARKWRARATQGCQRRSQILPPL